MSAPTRVLVVAETESAVADSLRDEDGVAVTTATPAGAMEALDGTDCVLVPADGNGIDVVDSLGPTVTDRPLLFVAPGADDDSLVRAIDAGATDYVRTDDPRLLVHRVRTAIECERARRGDARASRYERLVENLPVGVFRTTPGPDGEIVDASETFAAILGYDSPAALVGEPATTGYRNPDDRQRFSEKLAAEGVVRNEELELTRPDGETVWVTETAIRTEEDGRVYFDGIVQDITDRKRRERELAATKARFEALFEESPDMVFVHDGDGVIQRVNRRTCEKLGYDREQLEGMDVCDVDVSVDEQEARRTWESLPAGETPMFDGIYERADGSRFPVEVHLTRLDDGEFLAICRDVTSRRERERELQRHNERLEEFVDVLSHDIPNHLDVAQTRLDIARTREDLDQLEHVATAHDRIESVVRDMKRLVEHGREVETTEWVRLSDVASVCWSGTQCGDDTSLSVTVDGYVRASESRLKQLLENLFWNACDHAGPDVSVRAGLLEDGFFVADDGPGIPPDDREEVLSLGYTTDDDHAGFGLAIVREIARSHGWTVDVTDSESGGARFEFTGVDVRQE